MNNKKILLLAFKFPPYAGVGAFRWAQLCKYLARLGHEIHVVTVPWTLHGPNSLIEAINHPNIHLYPISSGGFHNIRIKNYNSRLRNGIRNKLFVHVVDKFFYPHDEAQRWSRHLLPYCEKLILEKTIRVVVATGHPFTVNYHAAMLKKYNPELILIQDFRDLWAADRIFKGSPALCLEKNKMESFALRQADAVVTVTNGYKACLEENADGTPVHVIENGFDPELFTGSKFVFKPNQLVYKLIYLGSTSYGREECCDAILRFISQNQTRFRVSFIGFMPRGILNKYSCLFDSGICAFKKSMSHEESIKELENSDIALHFTARLVPEALSTKIYEYAAAKKPIISINFGGESEELILANQWGISLNPDRDDFESKIGSLLEGNIPLNFDNQRIMHYSYREIAVRYSNLIESLTR